MARMAGSARPTALFDVRVGKDVNVLMACGLGGTSLINANVCLSPDARVFDDTAWPGEVRRDRLLAEGFVRARHMLRPEVSPNASSYEKVAALRTAALAFERSVKPIPLHVTYESGPNAAGVQQEACTECGDCCGGATSAPRRRRFRPTSLMRRPSVPRCSQACVCCRCRRTSGTAGVSG